MKKRLISFTLAVMLFMISGCASIQVNIKEKDVPAQEASLEEAPAEETLTAQAEPADYETGGGKPWIDSDLKENVSEDTPVDPRDDFNLYANKDWKLRNEIPDGYSSWSHFHERNLELKKQGIELLTDESLTGHDAELVQTYNRLVLDWDARNASGVSEIRDLYERIMNLSDIEDITDLLTDPDNYYLVYGFVDLEATTGFNDPDLYLVGISPSSLILGDSAEYRARSEYGDMLYGLNKDMFIYIAQRMGMDEAEAAKRFDNAIDLETVLSEKIYSSAEENMDDFFDKINNEMSYADTVALAKVFPLEKILTAREYKYDGNYLVFRSDYFELLDEIYTDDNADRIRDLMVVRYLLGHASHLDRDIYDMLEELKSKYIGISGSMPDEEMAYTRVSNLLPASMQKVYISKYGSEEDKQKMTDLCQEVIDTYRELLSENEWVSDEVKDYAIEKLDNIVIHAAYPEKFRDTSYIDFTGCSLLEADNTLSRAGQVYERSLIGTKLDEEMWAEFISVLTCNASYFFSDNSINIYMGMMGEPFYSSDMCTEDLYASVVAFWIGHEISHAFDNNGAQFDAEGKYRDWWTENDKAEFKRRVSKVDDYLDGIIAFGDTHFIGSSIDTEMIADITGLQCALRMASKIDGFDYDRFFTKYGELYAVLALYSNELSQIMRDPHPLEYIRTNVSIQQFDEFFETYGVKEGDNMYLAPEDRLIIW